MRTIIEGSISNMMSQLGGFILFGVIVVCVFAIVYLNKKEAVIEFISKDGKPIKVVQSHILSYPTDDSLIYDEQRPFIPTPSRPRTEVLGDDA